MIVEKQIEEGEITAYIKENKWVMKSWELD